MKERTEIEKALKEYAQALLLPKENIHLPIIPLLNEGESIPLLYKSLNDGFSSRLSRNQLVLPNFSESETVAIFTDYGGEAKNSKYLTYTVTLVSYGHLAAFDRIMKNIRIKYNLNDPIKEIAFKDLRYGPIKRSLDEYLKAVNDTVNGLAFTLIVDKNIISLADRNEKESKELVSKLLKERGFGTFKIDVAEKLYRIVNIVSYLVHLLVPNGKKIFWMSDHDSTIGSNEKHIQAAKLLNSAFYSFEDASYNTVGYAKPFSKDEDTLFLDLLSISDLTAGAIEHYLTRQKVLSNTEFTINSEANQILTWLANNGLAFKKLNYIIDYDLTKNAYNGGFMDFSLKEIPENANYIDVTF